MALLKDVSHDEPYINAAKPHKRHKNLIKKIYLWKAFFVDMIHHDDLVVRCSTGPSGTGKKETVQDHIQILNHPFFFYFHLFVFRVMGMLMLICTPKGQFRPINL